MFLFFLSASALASPAYNFACDFAFFGMPFAHVKLELGPEGLPGPVAYVNMTGKAQEADATPAPRQADEAFRVWLAHDSEGESISLTVWSREKALLTNHKIPFGRELPGSCKIL